MLRRLRIAAVARIAAAAILVTLSGVPRAVALAAPAEKHRCGCQGNAGGAHECECARCHEAALAAQATDERLPTCHRAAARKALAGAGSRSSRGAPCVEGSCGSGTRAPLTIAGLEPFCLPATRALAVPLREGRQPARGGPARDRALEPETPPPRAA